jgi:hypothetical protein
MDGNEEIDNHPGSVLGEFSGGPVPAVRQTPSTTTRSSGKALRFTANCRSSTTAPPTTSPLLKGNPTTWAPPSVHGPGSGDRGARGPVRTTGKGRATGVCRPSGPCCRFVPNPKTPAPSKTPGRRRGGTGAILVVPAVPRRSDVHTSEVPPNVRTASPFARRTILTAHARTPEGSKREISISAATSSIEIHRRLPAGDQNAFQFAFDRVRGGGGKGVGNNVEQPFFTGPGGQSGFASAPTRFDERDGAPRAIVRRMFRL